MSVLTKFLKLVKPEKNDYVDVEKHISENYDKIDSQTEKLSDEISKKASKTILGRMIVGDNLTVDSNGRVSGNPQYTHPTGNGNSHLPSGGASGNFLKWLSAGVGQWVNITWSDITGRPSSFPPSSHNQASNTINLMTGYTKSSSTGAIATTDTLNGAVGKLEKALDGKAPSLHTHKKSEISDFPSSMPPTAHKHTKSDITDFPTSLKNPYSLTIQANGSTLGSYDGGSAKTFNINANSVGAYTKNEVDTKFKNFCPIPIGGVLPMWNETNPTSLYLGTTWELITAGKYIQTGNTALQTGGSNSVSIQKVNLPNIKLKIDSFSLSIPPHSHKIKRSPWNGNNWKGEGVQAENINSTSGTTQTENSLTFTTGITSPNTEVLGSGTPLNIQPSYIVLKFWKRLS